MTEYNCVDKANDILNLPVMDISGEDFIPSNHDISLFIPDLKEQERSSATIQKYAYDLYSLLKFLQDRTLTKTVLIDWKQELIDN